MNLDGSPVVGFANAFTSKYKASKLILRFLELAGVKTIKSTITKPKMLEAGTTLASADFCLPLRVYIGHIYNLITENPELDYILAPIIKSEYPSSSTCAKYRDLDGVIIRSLGTISGYRFKQNNFQNLEKLEHLIGQETTQRLMKRVERLPFIIAPEIESLDEIHLKSICKKVYFDITNNTSVYGRLSPEMKKKNKELDEIFDKAYEEVIVEDLQKYEKFLENPMNIRLALVGRSYLVEDSTLSADIKRYFTKKGVSIITIDDLPFHALEENYKKVTGFYDYHRIGQAFINKVLDEVDGFILIGSFGCHPDAFQMEYFSNFLADKGKACWTFKFDEQAGGVGFHTRFETIYGFLEQKRNDRVHNRNHSRLTDIKMLVGSKKVQKEQLSPIFIWPDMGTGISILIKEVWHQIGLDKYLYPPLAVNEETIHRGNTEYTETCSPFALYLGSLRETLDRLLQELENTSPRRIIILMAGGKGPCTFGWYAIAGQKTLLEEYNQRLAIAGHTLEMLAIDNEGRNVITFLQGLAAIAENDKLKQVISKLEVIESKHVDRFKKIAEEIKLIKLLKQIVWPSWEKLLAYEEIQNTALVVRAHELKRGATTQRLKKIIHTLEKAHTLADIEKVKHTAIANLNEIEVDQEQRPRVVVVGEIYVALTPFANRGTVDNYLGLHGIEAVEGMRLSHFIRGAFKGLKHHYVQNQELLKPILKFLERTTGFNPNSWVREPLAQPFLEHEVGGDGQPTIAHARYHIENDGVDGVLHIYPFKCMPEGIAKDALIEMSQLYGIKTLHLSFDKEIEIERLKTEIGTFATLLRQDMEKKRDSVNLIAAEISRRKMIGATIEGLYKQGKNQIVVK